MPEDEKLNEVAEEVGQKIMAGEEEIALDQPFPEELKDDTATKEESPDTSPSDVKKEDAEDSKDDEPEQAEESKDDDKDDKPKKSKTRHFGHDVDRFVLLLVGMGIIICVIGIILLLLIGLLAGITCLIIGAILIIFGVLAPLGY